MDAVIGDAKLRSKRDLIEKFINENLDKIPIGDDVTESFQQFWQVEKETALIRLCKDEQADRNKIEAIIAKYLFTKREPLQDDVINTLHQKPKILQRKKVGQRLLDKVIAFIKTFVLDAPE